MRSSFHATPSFILTFGSFRGLRPLPEVLLVPALISEAEVGHQPGAGVGRHLGQLVPCAGEQGAETGLLNDSHSRFQVRK